MYCFYYRDEKNKDLFKKYDASIEYFNVTNCLKGFNTIKSKDINIIDSLYEDLLKKEIVSNILVIKLYNKIIGKKLIKNKNLIKYDKKYNIYQSPPTDIAIKNS